MQIDYPEPAFVEDCETEICPGMHEEMLGMHFEMRALD
jgi:hypothetical protein